MRAEIELTEMSPVKVAVTDPNDTLTQPINQQARIPHINRQTLVSTIPSVRRPQNMLLYWLVCLMQLATIFLSLLLVILPKQQLKWAYLTYIIMTCVRSIIFLASSLHLVGLIKPLFKLYFLMDNVFLFEIATDITYIFLNYQKDVDYVMGAIVCYPILLFCLCGNGRVMLVYCQWQPWQVIFYKMIKLVGSTYFLVYGCYLLIGGTLAEGTKEIFLLWVFTTCAFWGEMCFQVNTKDESDNLNTNYVLLDLDQ